jgi:hypothetical protein
MEADDRDFLLALSRNTYFAAGHGRMAIRFPGWITTATAVSSLGACMTFSRPPMLPPPGSLPGQSHDKWPGWPQL